MNPALRMEITYSNVNPLPFWSYPNGGFWNYEGGRWKPELRTRIDYEMKKAEVNKYDGYVYSMCIHNI